MLFICIEKENEKEMNAMYILTPFHNQRKRKEKLSGKGPSYDSFLMKPQNRVNGEKPCKRPSHQNRILDVAGAHNQGSPAT